MHVSGKSDGEEIVDCCNYSSSEDQYTIIFQLFTSPRNLAPFHFYFRGPATLFISSWAFFFCFCCRQLYILQIVIVMWISDNLAWSGQECQKSFQEFVITTPFNFNFATLCITTKPSFVKQSDRNKPILCWFEEISMAEFVIFVGWSHLIQCIFSCMLPFPW